MKHVQYYPKCAWTTDVLLHVLCTQLQVIMGGFVHQLFNVPIDLQHDLVLPHGLSEGSDGRDPLCPQ